MAAVSVGHGLSWCKNHGGDDRYVGDTDKSDGHDENSEGLAAIGAVAGTAASGISTSRPRDAFGPFFSLPRGGARAGQRPALAKLTPRIAWNNSTRLQIERNRFLRRTGSAPRSEWRSPAGWAG